MLLILPSRFARGCVHVLDAAIKSADLSNNSTSILT